MYLFIDEQYRIFKAPTLTGKLRSFVKQGKLSVVSLTAERPIQGMNIDGSFSDIQWLPGDFEPEPSEIDELKSMYQDRDEELAVSCDLAVKATAEACYEICRKSYQSTLCAEIKEKFGLEI